MASEVACGLIFRLLLPICLATGEFVLVVSITVNSLLATHSINADFNCSMWEKSIRQIGFESVIGADPMNGIRVFLPDIGMFLTGLAVWLVCRMIVPSVNHINAFLSAKEEEEKLSLEGNILLEEDHEGEEHEEEEEAKESAKMKVLRFVAGVASKVKEIIGDLITTAGKVVVTILLGLTGAMLPSLTSAVYFFVFLFLCTWWSFCRTIDTLLFSCMCVLMAIFSAGHLVILYLYQFQFFQEAITTDDYYIRLFGISPLIRVDCTHTWKLNKNPDLYWHHFVNPGMLLLLYYTLATLIRLWLQEPTGQMEVGPSVSLAVQPPRTASCSKCLLGALQGPNENSFEFTTTDNGPVGVDLYSTPHYKMDQLPSEMGMEGGKKDGEETETETEGEDREKASAVVTVFRFIMKQSYICALIAMMAWSITYVSWLTFVFLLWSCILWMVRDRRRYAMITSPFMVMYGNLLLVLQYIWSFEVLNKVSGFFLKGNVPFSELWTKMLCLLSFWLLLRQTLMEREEKLSHTEAALSDVVVDQDKAKAEEEERRSSEKEEEEGEGGEPDVVQVLGSLIMALLVKYWLYICSGMFFFVSFEGRIVMYKIIYMMMFLSCVALYQVHYEWWRRALKYFWMSVVMYTMLVLILVYTFQFDTSPPFWRSLTGMDDKLEDLGLETFSVPELFSRIFIPASFLLVCILHLHYFHDRFLALTDLQALVAKEESTIYSHAKVNGRVYVIMNRWVPCSLSEASIPIHPSIPIRPIHPEINRPPYPPIPSLLDTPPPSSTNKWHLVVDRLTVLFLKFLEYFHKLQLFIWWLLEIHIIKIVSCYIILVSIKEVSLFNSVFLASWAFALPFTQVRPIASSICTVWTCVIVICKMLYQLKSIDPEFYSSNCTLPAGYELKIMEELTSESVLYKKPVDPANWVGLMKSEPLLEYLRNNLLMLAILAFEVTIYRHQQYFRLRNKLTPPAARIIFHGITRQHLDQGIVNFVKYFVNYFFYKFGLETCLLLVVNVIGQRMDFYAMLHAFALSVVMYRRRRKAIAEIWPKYCCFLACMITFQYFMCVGIPPAACKDYPWRFPNSGTESNVVKWLYVPDFHTKPNPMFLFYDFMLLLCASLQRQVFDDENKAAVRLMAGDNVEICRDLDAATFSVHNPVPDFIHCRSYLDMLKVTMFSYLFWFVLTILFFTGTTRISVFCMGYLVACFYFLLFGGELLLKPIKKILRLWDLLIAYNVFVITMKNILSILACGYIHTLLVKHCWLIQLLSLAYIADQCELPKDEAGIIWDSICFAFLLLQRRVFMSYYFLHVVADIRASQILASRGAELFQATIVKAVRARLDEEHRSMEQLKRQMDRIKMRQQKFKRGKEKMLSMTQESGEGQSLVPPEEEDDERTKAKTKKKQWWRPWVDHASMVRSGDYYLFETDSEEEEEEEDKTEEDLPKKSAFQFLYHAWITDPKTALREKAKERRKFWKKYTKGVRRDLPEGVGEDEDSKKSKGPDNVIKRMYNIIKFLLVLCQTTVDSFTKWMNEMCQEHIDISSVLRIERCMLTREVKKGNVPSRDHIHVYYQKAMRLNMSRQSSMDLLSEDDSGSQRPPGANMAARRPLPRRLSVHTSGYTEATMLSRQSTLDDLDGMPECIPKTSERARPKLRKIYGMDASNSSADSGSSLVSSEATQCITLYSRQGTTDTIEEVEDEHDLGEDGRQAEPRGCQEPEGSLDPGGSQEQEGSGRSALLYTPDTDASKTSDAEVPPSYSKVVSFDRLEVSDDDSDMDRGRMAMTSDSRSEGSTRSDLAQPSMMTELTASELLLSKMFYDEELDQSEKFYDSQPLGLQLGYALYNMLVAHSEMVCYLVIILNHIMSANLATLVIPINIFLWAMLSVPRPSKRFWMTAIVYTEVTICIKYFFQFGFFPFNQMKAEKSKPYHPPNIIGVEKKDGYAHYDLIQLLALFFHRSILKCHGLWDEDDKRQQKREQAAQETSEDEGNGSRGSVRSLDVDGPVDSVQVQMHHSQQKTFQRRKSSSGGSFISHRSGLSSARSKRGSTASHNSSRHDGSEASVQKSRKQLMAEKLREQLIRGKAMVVKRCMDFYEPIRQFFYNLIHPEYSAVTDVYVLMFLADTVDFIIIVFGFWAFGKHSAADITSSLSEDQVPGPFLVMVLIQFGSMVVDRALYLRKTVMGKVVFQVILVFGIHFWMFFILPGVTEKRFNQNRVAQMWYFVKCIYFGLSAYQIRCGYPTRVLGNFLTKSYNYLNLFLFQGFRLVPFLTELRAVMDWVWTDTSLSLSSWICVEDIYAHIFVLKCWRESEKKFPQPRGQKKKATVKYGLGGMIVALLICIVWFPLLFMSLVKSVAGVVNRPLDVSLTITLAGFQATVTSQGSLVLLHHVYLSCVDPLQECMQWLETYQYEDLTIAELEGSSNSLWTISPPSRKNLIDMLQHPGEEFTITVSWSIQRNLTLGAKAEFATGKLVEPPLCIIILIIINIMRIHSYLSLERSAQSSGEVREWWVVNQSEPGSIKKKTNMTGLDLYIFSDQVSPPSLGFLAGYGIMGLYASVVLVIGKFVREFFSGISHTIMFEELPNVDRILKLCTDIFLVRETGELDLEEDMYAKLIFLYRSPETMIKWTREKTE
uniref:Piezo-type mechanosensitive ion channel component n=1 Tax=Gadus morhua TaxID=8049 RepID=A0A8C5CQV8_GADMO